MPSLPFQVTAQLQDGQARCGRLETPHGTVETPAFMPVGTVGAVKTVSAGDLQALGYEQILCNTYHLGLRPGTSAVKARGGLHRFMGWHGGILTDSGGYQVMSLSKMRDISDQGVVFRSHLDGSQMELTPERVIEMQAELGVDISMMLDECPPYPCTRDEAAAAMERTHRWAPRNLSAQAEEQAIFGIVQGGVHMDLRTESAQFFAQLPCQGYAVGGVSVGEPTEMQYPVVAHTAPLLPADKPRYLMGVGHPRDIIHGVKSGIDLFDCVLPTRMARHNALYTLQGRINARAARWAEVDGPHDPDSVFPALEGISAAYLRHLLHIGEPMGARFATLHNLAFYARLMREIREAIRANQWEALEARYAQA